MALLFAPKIGTIVTVDFDQGFRAPEMVKCRLAVVISPPIKEWGKLVTVIPLSTTAPLPAMPYHCQVDIPFRLPPYWGNRLRWAKGDMVNAVGFHRVDLLLLGKDVNGRRQYQMATLSDEMLRRLHSCVLHSLGLLP